MGVDERVLVVPNRLWEGEGLLLLSDADFQDYLREIRRQGSFLLRSDVERGGFLQQVIPYVLLRSVGSHGVASYATYTRHGGGEARLEQRVSLGIGGHINQDGYPFGGVSEYLCPVQHGLLRELAEELDIPVGPHFIMPLGLVADRSNEVGRVHLGLVYILTLGFGFDPWRVKLKEGEGLKGLTWTTVPDLARAAQEETINFEPWSRLLLPTLCRLNLALVGSGMMGGSSEG